MHCTPFSGLFCYCLCWTVLLFFVIIRNMRERYNTANGFLTNEQKEWLRKCPHVVGFTDKTIQWSEAFIIAFCKAYSAGEPAKAFLRRNNIDVDLIGKTRIAFFRNCFCKRWDPINNRLLPASYYKGAKDILPELRSEQLKNEGNAASITDAKRLSKLEQEIIYLKQETNALKKIFMANNQAGKMK